MNESELGPEEGPLMRARLHIRGGRRRLRQGKVSLGILTLYDAMVSAMQWYIVSHGLDVEADTGDVDIKDDRAVFVMLHRSGVIDGRFDYQEFNNLVEKALKTELDNFNYSGVLSGIESVMTQLGVMPFDEDKLPPEDPATV